MNIYKKKIELDCHADRLTARFKNWELLNGDFKKDLKTCNSTEAL